MLSFPKILTELRMKLINLKREKKTRKDPWFRVLNQHSRDQGEHQIESLKNQESENSGEVLIQSLEGLG